MKSIGIDIGTYSVKVVEINSTQKGFTLAECFEKELPQNPGAETHLEVIEYLRQLLSQYDPAQTHFVMALRQDRVTHRLKTFPFADRLKIIKSLPFELEEEVPFSSDSAIFDAKIIKLAGSQTEVLASVAQKSKIAEAIQLAQDSGVDLSVLSAEGCAFSNLYEKWNEPILAEPPGSIQFEENEKPERFVTMALNIGHTHTVACIYENNRPIAIRSLLWGCKNVIEAVAKKYELTFIEAMKEVKTKAFILTTKQGASFDQVTFSETIAKSFREMTRDLQLTILELKSELNATVKRIEISGGGSLVQNLNAFITQQLEIPANRIGLLDQFSQVAFEKSARVDACFSLAVGLALDGLRKPRNPAVNFLKQEFALRSDGLKLFWDRWGYSTQIGAAMLVLLFIYANLRQSYSEILVEEAENILVSQAKSVAKLPKKQANEAGVKKYIKENKKRAAELKTLAALAQLNSGVELLRKISEQSPPTGRMQLDVTQVRVNDQNVTIEGYTASPREVSLFSDSIKSLSTDGRVTVLASALPPRVNQTSFSVELKMDRGLPSSGAANQKSPAQPPSVRRGSR